MKICNTTNCNSKVEARGLCAKHYQAYWARRNAERITLRNALARCYSKTGRDYPSYGGRGIKVCDRWRFGEGGLTPLECFVADMGKKPSPRHSLDRIDPNGDYRPSNCRWATPTMQSINQRVGRNNVSGHRGVHWRKDVSKWRAVIQVDGKRIVLGHFDQVDEAVKAYEGAKEKYHDGLFR